MPQLVRVGRDVGDPAQLEDAVSRDQTLACRWVLFLAASQACRRGPMRVLVRVVAFGTQACPLSLLSDYRTHRLDSVFEAKVGRLVWQWPLEVSGDPSRLSLMSPESQWPARSPIA